MNQTNIVDQLGLELRWYEKVWDLSRKVEVPESTGFDPATARARADKIAKHLSNSRQLLGWNFSEPPVNGFPSQEEAQFWLDYLADRSHRDPSASDWWHVTDPPKPLMVLLRYAADPEGFVEDYCNGQFRVKRYNRTDVVISLGWRLVWDRLTADQRYKLYDLTRAADRTEHLGNGNIIQAAYLRAIFTGDASETVPHINQALKEADAGEPSSLHAPWTAYFAPTPEDRAKLANIIDIVTRPEYAMLWLANTGSVGFDAFVQQLSERSKDEAKPIIETIGARLKGPGAVPLFAKIATTKHALGAMDWLRKNTELILNADLNHEEAKTVQPILRSMDVEKLREYRDTVCSTLAALIDDIVAEAELPAFDPSTSWWADAVYKGKGKKLPVYAQPSALPPLVVGGARLMEPEVKMLLAALQTEDRDLPILRALRDNVQPTTLDAFATELLECWLDNGAPAKDKWLMTGSGCIGGDGFVLQLTPMIREWPGQSQHKRATHGLDALRNVGSDLALQQISGIASKVKFAGIKKRAAEAMDEIAETKGLTRDELEDRIIPDGGLDSTGRRVFSYGPRSFVATLTPECKVVARLLDEDGRPTGKPKASLPAPNKSDDQELAAASKKEYSLLKKGLTSAAKLQAIRFEQAMISGRRWTGEEFANFFASNPLVRSLLAGIVWGIYRDDARVGLGRLDESGELIDAGDEPIDVSDSTVGIIHPGDLSDMEKAEWGEVQADFELQEAFPQLSRQIHELPADQGDHLVLQGVEQGLVDSRRMVGSLKRSGWDRGAVLDAGGYSLYYRYFDNANVTAVFQFDYLSIDFDYMDDQVSIEGVYLVAGKKDAVELDYGHVPGKHPGTISRDWEFVKWSELPRVVASEIIAAVRAAGG
ncbi:DUF4132 domain-containing protein [Corynebacterium sp. H130]|uniref:DUF4132 domain-containing protein n=1 Tax=Corynebacterium sp. H130 TaxID=3133444 RepID=UPI0030A7DB56